MTLIIGQTSWKWDIQQNQDLENMLKDMAFCRLLENLVIDMVKKLMENATKTGIDAAKTASKRVVQKTAEATGDWLKIKYQIKLLQQVNQKKKKK